MRPATDGALLIDKGPNESSHDVVKKVRSAIRGKDKVKVGHAGTLDPFATGLLVCLVGQGTKLSQFIMAGEKEYVATLVLGVETDTMDPSGRVTATAAIPPMTVEQVRETAGRFTGRLRQVPPAYSAVRYQGKRAYQLARKGHAVSLEAREVEVHSFEIVSMALPEVTARIRCSSGTYIRRLASDLGKALGTGGHLRSLRRVRSGSFDVADAVCSTEIGGRARGTSLLERIIPMRESLLHMREVVVSPETAERVRQGRQPAWEELRPGLEEGPGWEADLKDGWIKVVSDHTLVAILHITAADGGNRGTVKIERVFLS